MIFIDSLRIGEGIEIDSFGVKHKLSLVEIGGSITNREAQFLLDQTKFYIDPSMGLTDLNKAKIYLQLYRNAKTEDSVDIILDLPRRYSIKRL